MPELPEVETVRIGLERHIVGCCFTGVHILHPRPVRYQAGGPDAFAAAVAGRKIDAVRRRGKYLWLVLGPDALLCHLGMSGQFRICQPGDEMLRNTRVVFNLDDGRQLRFVDQRMFGGLEFLSGEARCPVPHIAPDPFSSDFHLHDVARRLRLKHTTIKRALLDQRLISGIGNIYADEALWRSRLHFALPTMLLGPRQATGLLHNATCVMREALEAGGTSFDTLYVNVNGESGYFERGLAVYGRAGLPCIRCGAEIVREPFMNRSSFRCPRCQRLRLR